MLRKFRPLLTAATALLVVAAAVAPASAAPGQFSLGGNFGTGIYSMGTVSDSLEANGLERMSSGWEFGGSLRYQFSEKAALDIEASLLKPKSTNSSPGNPDEIYSAPALAIPLSLIYTLSENDQYGFNLVVGAGILSGAKLRGEVDPIEVESTSKSAVFGQAGLESAWKVSPQFALTARAIGRISGKPEVDFLGDPIELDYTGVVLGLGARAFFGGTAE